MKDEAEFNRIVANSLKASKTIINDKEMILPYSRDYILL